MSTPSANGQGLAQQGSKLLPSSLTSKADVGEPQPAGQRHQQHVVAAAAHA